MNTQIEMETGENNYTVPFSSHSNFNELEMFVASVRPGVIKNLNPIARDPLRKTGDIKNIVQYQYFLQNMYKRGLDYFNQKYVDPSTLSHEYLSYSKSAKKTKEFLA